jgi:hypothetical protein
MDSIGIGSLAKRAGVGIDIVRYYSEVVLCTRRLCDSRARQA